MNINHINSMKLAQNYEESFFLRIAKGKQTDGKRINHRIYSSAFLLLSFHDPPPFAILLRSQPPAIRSGFSALADFKPLLCYFLNLALHGKPTTPSHCFFPSAAPPRSIFSR